VSSEKEPHLTLCYLGNPGYDQEQLTRIEEYIEHASTLLNRFTLEVERRGVLGDKDADVLFFYKDYARQIDTFRTQLLRQPLISAAYNAEDQYENWTPHLTLGYPETPAKKPPNDRDAGITFVEFDRIALWTQDSAGPTFQLKPYRYDMEVAMSSLTHYGVKGMKWGVHRDNPSGGSSRPRLSEDAREVVKASNKIQTHGTGSLSNKELQSVISRMNLENQYHNLTSQNHDQLDVGLKTANKILKIGKTVEDVRRFMDTPTGKVIAGGIKVGTAYFTGGGSAAAAAGAQVAVRRMNNHYTNTGN
jgi:2'-5' RNA ligase